MNALTAVLFATVVTMAAAYYGGGYELHDNKGYPFGSGYGFARTSNGIVAAYNNADRQKEVNHIAEYVDASSGTAKYYGVPGTGRYLDRHHFKRPTYGYGK